MADPRAELLAILTALRGAEEASALLAPIEPFFDTVTTEGLLSQSPTPEDIAGMRDALAALSGESVTLEFVSVAALPPPPADAHHQEYCRRHRLNAAFPMGDYIFRVLGKNCDTQYEDVVSPAADALGVLLDTAFPPAIHALLSGILEWAGDAWIGVPIRAVVELFYEYAVRAARGQRDVCMRLGAVLNRMPRVLVFTRLAEEYGPMRALVAGE